MPIDDIRKLQVVGTGTMGQKISLQCARCGYEVIACDAVLKSLENARTRIPAYAAGLVAEGEMTPEESEAALSRICFSSDLQTYPDPAYRRPGFLGGDPE